ncbi:polymorphic toxin-type HINT domain-containing protein [Micromonospora carbonacea]|uniref:polymorphic toxin-type HINT domain-containing protein n=1 Tax=Micromonospora carbonacea TaxID=47853 RepID=UPI003718B339
MSFSGDTRVLMADGSTRRLEDVRVGDEVIAADPETGEQGPRIVTNVWVHEDELVDLRIGDAFVTTTEDHPFWNHTDREWQRADEIDRGDWALGSDGIAPSIGGLEWSSATAASAYNLTVDGIHTYYVLAGDTPVLVHNDNGPIDLNGKSYTVWQRGPYRIDIEARNGTKQTHFQVQIKGVGSGDAPKCQFDPETGKFTGMPKSLERDLAKNYPDYRKGLSRGADVFGRVIGTCG